MMKMLAPFLAAALVGAVATSTPQPLNSGRLANRQFLVVTPLGHGSARYFGSGSLDGERSASRAIIIVHGVLRDADYYYDNGMIAIAAAHAANTLLIAPQFVESSDLKGHDVPSGTLRWNERWPGGSDATAPAPISTYDVFDAILARLSDRRR